MATIGADELIYRIRKNGGAVGIDNMLLGKQILTLIQSLGGSKKTPDQPSFYDTRDTATNVSENGLPKTSEQYDISYGMLPVIYTTIDSW